MATRWQSLLIHCFNMERLLTEDWRAELLCVTWDHHEWIWGGQVTHTLWFCPICLFIAAAASTANFLPPVGFIALRHSLFWAGLISNNTMSCYRCRGKYERGSIQIFSLSPTSHPLLSFHNESPLPTNQWGVTSLCIQVSLSCWCVLFCVCINVAQSRIRLSCWGVTFTHL